MDDYSKGPITQRRHKTIRRIVRPLALPILDEIAFRKHISLIPELGFRFRPAPGAPKSMGNGTFELAERRVLGEALTWADYFINVGANSGYFTLQALAANVPTSAVEPDRRNLDFLLRNVVANGWSTNVEVLPVALSDETGVVSIFGGGTGASLIPGWAGATQSRLVPASTLDRMYASRALGERILMMIDVEGAEYKCLSGGREFFRLNPNMMVLMEVGFSAHHPDGYNPNVLETFALMHEMGFAAFAISDELEHLRLVDIEAITAHKMPPRNQNFVFRRGDIP